MNVRILGVLVILIIGTSLTGCGCFQQAIKGEKAPPSPPPEARILKPEEKPAIPITPPQETPKVVTPSPVPSPVTAPTPKVAEPQYVLKDINFDFDKYNIRPQDAEILKENLNWFKANPGKRVRIEGHCDERGTSEYNLILGQKRADATKNYLVNLGVDEKLLETVSYGKERPLDPGHNEEAWAKNRRAHFLILP
ncbi:MAG: peptidoglycan-associated lipoprotein Pal [Deltaproteobacteria bacterium]|nr:peptidoglycan-associated lipoprotein Pal [Deltaproteobacteria bacterium]